MLLLLPFLRLLLLLSLLSPLSAVRCRCSCRCVPLRFSSGCTPFSLTALCCRLTVSILGLRFETSSSTAKSLCELLYDEIRWYENYVPFTKIDSWRSSVNRVVVTIYFILLNIKDTIRNAAVDPKGTVVLDPFRTIVLDPPTLSSIRLKGCKQAMTFTMLHQSISVRYEWFPYEMTEIKCMIRLQYKVLGTSRPYRTKTRYGYRSTTN